MNINQIYVHEGNAHGEGKAPYSLIIMKYFCLRRWTTFEIGPSGVHALPLVYWTIRSCWARQLDQGLVNRSSFISNRFLNK